MWMMTEGYQKPLMTINLSQYQSRITSFLMVSIYRSVQSAGQHMDIRIGLRINNLLV